jgi:hypothetical protein
MSRRCRYIHHRTLVRCRRKTRHPTYCSFHRRRITQSAPDQESVDCCPICLDTDTVVPFQCGHRFCLTCREKLRDIICPLCRSFIGSDLNPGELYTTIQRMVSDRVSTEVEGLRTQLDNIHQEETRTPFIRLIEHPYPDLFDE